MNDLRQRIPSGVKGRRLSPWNRGPMVRTVKALDSWVALNKTPRTTP